MTKHKRKQVADLVTEQVVAGLNRGFIPWRKPWANNTHPGNFVTGHKYQGVNLIMSQLAVDVGGYEYPLFATFKQLQSKDWKLRKGAKGHMIVFTTRYEREVETVDGNGDVSSELKKVTVLKYYYVFNIQDIDGVNVADYVKQFKIKRNGKADAMLNRKQPVISYGKSKACYHPKQDCIDLPSQADFPKPGEFYLTAFHELTHWTGHESRCNRDMNGGFGDNLYSKEELVAECGSNMLAMLCGIENKVPDNSIAYVQSWIKALNNDHKLVIHASSQANKAVDWLTN